MKVKSIIHKTSNIKNLDNSTSKSSLSEYNESHYFDWKEIYIQRRIRKLYNLDPEVNSSLQTDDLFPENNTSIQISQISDIGELEWKCLFLFIS